MYSHKNLVFRTVFYQPWLPKADILYECDLLSLHYSQVSHLCFRERDESLPLLNSPLTMLSNSPLALFFGPNAAAKRKHYRERKADQNGS